MDEIEAEIVSEPTLFELAAEANHWHQEALNHAGSAVECAWYAGRALNLAKEQRRHGDWLPWLSENFNGSHDTATRYMTLAANYASVRNLDSPQSVRSLLKAITSKKDRENKRREREQEQQEELELSESLPVDLRLGDFRAVLSDVSDVDAVITDPPYPREFLNLFDELGSVAGRILKPGGLCAIMVGQSYLPDIFSRLTGLTYRWTLAYLTPGGQSVQIWDRNINTFWKPVLLYTNGPSEATEWIGDVTASAINDNDKNHHHWGQSESGMADLVRRLTKPGQLICDPFLGGGTTAVVSHALGRRFVGCDIDQACINTTAKRFNR